MCVCENNSYMATSESTLVSPNGSSGLLRRKGKYISLVKKTPSPLQKLEYFFKNFLSFLFHFFFSSIFSPFFLH